MNVAVLIPTISGRERFLQQALSLISEQSVQPKFVEIINDPPIINRIDVAWRYKIGINRCKEKGADVIIFWEDDDWYKYNYIELLLKHWILSSRPDIFGLSKTIYYNIVKRKYLLINHPGRASMMSTMITKAVIPDWDDWYNQYVDMYLWKLDQYSKATMDNPFNTPIAIGIKHGIGSCAGGGHNWTDDKFKYDDRSMNYFSTLVDRDSFDFYSSFYGKKH